MDLDRRAQIQRSLRYLAESYLATMNVLEQALHLLGEELSLDPLTFLHKRPLPQDLQIRHADFCIDRSLWSVSFRSKVCFLGNTLPFNLLFHLARRLNTYVSYEELLAEVWQRVVSDMAIRTVAKNLRQLLRRDGLAELAESIDGSVYSHYALKLGPDKPGPG